MEGLFYIENVEYKEHLPFKVFLHNVRECGFHLHKELEMLFVLDGSILVQVEGNQYVCGIDDVVLVHGEELHFTHSMGDQNIVLVFQMDVLYADQWEPGFSQMRFLCNSTLSREGKDQEKYRRLRTELASLMAMSRKTEEGARLRMMERVFRILSLLVSEFRVGEREMQVDMSQIEESMRYFSRVARILKYLDTHYMDRISLSELAEREGVHPSYLSRFFHEKVGLAFKDYLQMVRLQKSLRDLITSSRTITEIAMDYGFPSVKAYETSFRKFYGSTPSAWRSSTMERLAPPPHSVYNPLSRKKAFRLLERYVSSEEDR
ncbi:transcriptional regulator, AraC family [Spirochaeta thermophila DSM 6578]|uniref:Transcriptional regulator, AraC family n=1 Tax=Winmispira thermophila (strain ATCC 700085 / DSM 6578 / Z-1203) TaxID=869211 RepID=G0GB19_WINT7|nr:AraC family transcriptional regulator [Spirochaeta thermophila]AEJ61043.1 transcriptional regulator, AraC family [Spirochaeta thermophila DSM 6578]